MRAIGQLFGQAFGRTLGQAVGRMLGGAWAGARAGSTGKSPYTGFSILAICSPDAPPGTGACPLHIETRTVLIWCSFDVYSHLISSYSQQFSRTIAWARPGAFED